MPKELVIALSLKHLHFLEQNQQIVYMHMNQNREHSLINQCENVVFVCLELS